MNNVRPVMINTSALNGDDTDKNISIQKKEDDFSLNITGSVDRDVPS